MDDNKRPCFCPDDKYLTVARRGARQLLSLQEAIADGASFTPAVSMCKLFSINPYQHMNAKMLAFLQGMHPRLGEHTVCLKLDANVAQMICNMYVAQCDVEMLDF
jgi:hypothetical protein